MCKTVWERKEVTQFSWDVERPCRVGDFDSLQGQTGAFWTGKQEVSTGFRGVLCDGVETADDKIRWGFHF